MIRQFAFIASTLALSASLAMPALAGDPVGQPGRGGDGHCPIPSLPTDPDCTREGAQTLSKSSRDEFPRCRNGRAGQPLPPGCRAKASEEDKRNQFPRTTPQPGHLG